MADNTNNFQRLRVRRAAANPLAFPPFPKLPEELKLKSVALGLALDRYNLEVEQWRQKVQYVLEQAIMALKLDPGDLRTLISQYTTNPVQSAPAVQKIQQIVPAAPAGFGPLTYQTNTVLVNGSTDLGSEFAIWPLAIYAARYTFTEDSYLAGLWLSTAMENPTPSRIAAWVTKSAGTPIEGGTEYIDLTAATNVWLHHISDNDLTTSKSSGTMWAVAEMPFVASGETITLWVTNAFDTEVVIDAALTVYRVTPTAKLTRYINNS